LPSACISAQTEIGDNGLAAGLQAFHGLPKWLSAKKPDELMLPFRSHRSIATAHIRAEALEIRNGRRAATNAKLALAEEMAV